MAEWSYSDFQKFCPPLASVPQATFDVFAAEASKQLSRDLIGDKIVRAGCLMTAHLMETSGVSGTTVSGPVQSESGGGASISFAVKPFNAEWLTQTRWGIALKQLFRLCSTGGWVP